MSEIPLDAYGVDDGECAYIPAPASREQAEEMASVFIENPQAKPCHMRLATTEECDARGWPEPAVLACKADHPDAVAGWCVE